MLKLGIIGAGGFSLEVFDLLVDIYKNKNLNIEEHVFFIDDYKAINTHLGLKLLKREDIDFAKTEIVIAISNAVTRKKIVDTLPHETKYGKIIHPSSYISPSSVVGDNVIISYNCVVSSRVKISNHSHLNYHTCIGHETEVEEFFTTAPGVKIGGNCKIGKNVYFGSNAATIQGITIAQNIKIGVGSAVMNNLKKPGTYLFNPSKKIL